MNSAIERRKHEHIETVLNEDVASKGVTPGFERFFFEHVALPELDLDAVDLSCRFLGKTLKAPFLVSSMTGGTERARGINLRLAEAAQTLGVAMGVGSQRAAIEKGGLEKSYGVRRVAPDILLFANLGAIQLSNGYGVDEARRAVEMIGADALFLHLNPLQEAVQAGGDRDWRGVLDGIESLVNALGVPVAVKEVGHGISASLARRLAGCGVAAIDVAGAGGTSWSEVEAYRQSDPVRAHIAHAFSSWGIPTALALSEVTAAVPGLPVIASGGIRTGIEAAKAIRLGARLVGAAAPLLATAVETTGTAEAHLAGLIEELRIAAFCAGAEDLAALRRARLRRADDWGVVEAPVAPRGRE